MKQTIWIIFFVLTACNSIISGDKLTKSDIQRIQKLGLLENDETIIRFYSEYKKSVAGNFFTNKRLASYWLDENDKTKNIINTAFYKEIITIDTVFYAGATYSPYMNVMRKDSSTFKVCFDGEKNEIRKTFIEAITKWKENQ